MVKLFQKAGVASFTFKLRFTDENGIPLTDEGEELIFVLSGKNGGI